jgi:hypothetical protein
MGLYIILRDTVTSFVHTAEASLCSGISAFSGLPIPPIERERSVRPLALMARAALQLRTRLQSPEYAKDVLTKLIDLIDL